MPLITKTIYAAVFPSSSPQQQRSTPMDVLLKMLPLGTLLVGAGYVLGWCLMTRFFQSFGVAPEEVGISTAWFLFRAPVWIYEIFLLGAACWISTKIPNTAWRVVFWAVVIAFRSAVIIGNQLAWRDYPFPVRTVTNFIVLALLIAFIVVFDRWWWSGRSRLTWNLLLVIAILSFGTSLINYWSYGAGMGKAVKAGYSIVYDKTTIGLTLYRTQPVAVYVMDSGEMVELLPCGSLLGSSNGSTLIWGLGEERHNGLWRLPTDQVFLHTGCDSVSPAEPTPTH